MKKISIATLSVLAAFTLVVAPALRADDDDDPNEKGGPKAHVHPVKGARPGGGGSPVMTYHGGKIMMTSHTAAIFWGTSWSSTIFQDDKITGLSSFYGGFSGSSYENTNTEYDGLGIHVGTASVYLGPIIDTSAGPTRAPKTSTILAEVCKVANGSSGLAPDADGNSYYAVYTDLPRGHAGYCAWHSSGSCTGTYGTRPVQFAFFFNLDGDAGCDPQDTTTGHSQGLAALANVSGHELSEALTDPASPGAWYDSSGAENADKCAWTFGAPSLDFGSGINFKVQGNWSNAAYNANSGYTKGGCIDGHPSP
jgi:hypothetical protein